MTNGRNSAVSLRDVCRELLTRRLAFTGDSAGSKSGLWSSDGQTGSNPQVLINALTGEVGTSLHMSGSRHAAVN